jgi:hypothetical protein
MAKILVEEGVRRENGTSSPVDTAGAQQLKLTLNIIYSLDHESLDVALEGSPDGVHWTELPHAGFAGKSYCGTYSSWVDLERCPEVRYLRASWSMNRWGREGARPSFGFSLAVDPERPTLATTAG